MNPCERCKTKTLCTLYGCEDRIALERDDEGYAVSVKRTPKKLTAAERALNRLETIKHDMRVHIITPIINGHLSGLSDAIRILTEEISKENT